MANNLFEGLPPPSDVREVSGEEKQFLEATGTNNTSESSDVSSAPTLKSSLKNESSEAHPAPLKSALKRPKSLLPCPQDTRSEKRLRFNTTTDASEEQIIEAMQKIASHIKNPSKFSKAAKLSIQLIQAGSVKATTSDNFFSVLEAAMSLPIPCTDASVRADYHALFSATQDVVEGSSFLTSNQRNQLSTWTICSVVANDLFTDDSFVFSKASGRIKEAITNLPIATRGEDLAEEIVSLPPDNLIGEVVNDPSPPAPNGTSINEMDPFGLDALLDETIMKTDSAKAKKNTNINTSEEDEIRRLMKSRREALVTCLEIAAKRYKTPWCQTTIDILAKHAFDNIGRFTCRQRVGIEKLWVSVREQQVRRKQGKTVSGKLDVNVFEWLQQKYANEKISIRHAVGGSGDRRTEQWLG